MVIRNWKNSPHTMAAVDEATSIVMGCIARRSPLATNRRVEIDRVLLDGMVYTCFGTGYYSASNGAPRKVEFMCKLERRVNFLGEDYFIENGWEATEPALEE